ncbi:MAG: nucleotidyltransferase family protein [Parvularculaceae bacterium]
MTGAEKIRAEPLFRAWRAPETVVTADGMTLSLVAYQARAAALGGKLAHRLKRAGLFDQLEPGFRRRMEAEIVAAARIADIAKYELRLIEAALAGFEGEVLLLKGAAYQNAGLRAGEGRLFGDIDILVSRSRLQDVEKAVIEAGWRFAKSNPYDDKYYREFMHELPPLEHGETGGHLDIHHTISPPTSRVRIDAEKLIADSAPLKGARWRLLSPEDMTIHAALHLFHDGPVAGHLRELFDFADLIEEFRASPEFGPKLRARAEMLDAGAILDLALRMANELLGARSDGAAPEGPARGMTAVLIRQVFRPPKPAPRRFPGTGRDIAAFLLYVRSHWRRMPPLMLGLHLLRKLFRRATPSRPGET